MTDLVSQTTIAPLGASAKALGAFYTDALVADFLVRWAIRSPHDRVMDPRATKLLATISGREDYTDPGEKFENVTLLLFQPVVTGGPEPVVRLIDARTRLEIDEQAYFSRLRAIYNERNPHAIIGEEAVDDEKG